MAEAEKKKPKQGPLVPRMVKSPSIEKVREILGQMAPEPPPAPVVLEIGQYYEGQGVYVGRWTPKDLTKTFNVFATPEDLPDGTRTYLETLEKIASLKDWHGHDGTNYATDKDIYTALREGSYNGGWIIPPAEVLRDILYPQRETGALAGTFKAEADSVSDSPDWYWSSTEDRDDSSYVLDVCFSDDYEGWGHKDDFRLSCRPVRLVPI